MKVRTQLAGGAAALALAVAGIGTALAGDTGAATADAANGSGVRRLQDAPEGQDAPRDRADCPREGGGEGGRTPSATTPEV